ncbi:hypothetical protein ACRCP2_32560, partial [Pseudomonas aeruginosa]
MNEAVAIPGFDPFMATNDGCIFNGETGKKLTADSTPSGHPVHAHLARHSTAIWPSGHLFHGHPAG